MSSLLEYLSKSFFPFSSRKWDFEDICSMLWLYSPYGTFMRGWKNKLNCFPTIVNAGHAVMGHKAALGEKKTQKKKQLQFASNVTLLASIVYVCMLETFLVFHQKWENLTNSEWWSKRESGARMPQGKLQVRRLL